MRWLDCLSSLVREDLASLKDLLETEFGDPFSDLDVRDAARMLCSIADLVLLNDPSTATADLLAGPCLHCAKMI